MFRWIAEGDTQWTKRPQVQEQVMTDTTVYSECCQSLRHYSNAIIAIRTLAMAQGLAVVSAQVYLLTTPLKAGPVPSLAAVFGLGLTIVFLAMHWNYKLHFDAALSNTLVVEASLNLPYPGTWQSYSQAKGRGVMSRLVRVIALHGVFAILLLAEIAFYCLAVSGVI